MLHVRILMLRGWFQTCHLWVNVQGALPATQFVLSLDAELDDARARDHMHEPGETVHPPKYGGIAHGALYVWQSWSQEIACTVHSLDCEAEKKKTNIRDYIAAIATEMYEMFSISRNKHVHIDEDAVCAWPLKCPHAISCQGRLHG
jgi:hypothetical protein